MHKIPTDAFDMLVTLEKRPFERAGREVVVRLLDETLPDGHEARRRLRSLLSARACRP